MGLEGVRRLKSDAAEEQGIERLHLNLDAVGAEFYGKPGGVPKTRFAMHIAVVGRANEGVDGDILSQVPKVPAQNGADLEVAVEDRRAERYRPYPVRLEQENAAGLDGTAGRAGPGRPVKAVCTGPPPGAGMRSI